MSTGTPTEDHQLLRRTVRDFAQSEIAPRITHMEATGQIERDLVTAMARQGWIGVTIPAAYGGMDAGHVAKTVIIEELSRVSAAMGAAAQASMLGVAKILHLGNDEQQHTWLPQIAEGVCLPTIAVTETESGGHVLGMRSRARRTGSGWVVTGRKVYIGNSHLGHLHGVIVCWATLKMPTEAALKMPMSEDAEAPLGWSQRGDCR